MRLDDPDFIAAMEQYDKIVQTHSWLYRCFPPRPTVCTACGASKEDFDLKPCPLVTL